MSKFKILKTNLSLNHAFLKYTIYRTIIDSFYIIALSTSQGEIASILDAAFMASIDG